MTLIAFISISIKADVADAINSIVGCFGVTHSTLVTNREETSTTNTTVRCSWEKAVLLTRLAFSTDQVFIFSLTNAKKFVCIPGCSFRTGHSLFTLIWVKIKSSSTSTLAGLIWRSSSWTRIITSIFLSLITWQAFKISKIIIQHTVAWNRLTNKFLSVVELFFIFTDTIRPCWVSSFWILSTWSANSLRENMIFFATASVAFFNPLLIYSASFNTQVKKFLKSIFALALISNLVKLLTRTANR